MARQIWLITDRPRKPPYSALTLPPPAFVRLPIGYVETLCFCCSPALARGGNRLGICAIEQKHQALVGTGIRGNRGSVDQKPHACAVRVVLAHGEQDRLLGGSCLPVRSMRQKAVITERPQMRIKGVDAILRRGLHDRAPAALERALEQVRQHFLERLFLQVIEEDLGRGQGR